MTFPFALPDWVPWWVPLILLLPALLYALAFLFMPFSVIGLKTRMEALEVRLDELQNEIRQLALRLPAGAQEMDFEEVYAPRPNPPRAAEPSFSRAAPVPPRHDVRREADDRYEDPLEVEDRPPPPANMRPIRRAEAAAPLRVTRAEPRFDRRK